MQSSIAYIMRHARALEQCLGESDFDRRLAAGGSEDALAMGQWLCRTQARPAKILSSPAVRARMTAEAVLAAWGKRPPAVEWNPGLYLAELATLSETLAQNSASPVLLIGHNPGLEDLVSFLLPQGANRSEGGAGMPTAAVYVIEYLRDHAGLQQASGRLKARMTPAEL